MKYYITFCKHTKLPKEGDYEKVKFYFKYICTNYIGKPEEDLKYKDISIEIKITKDLISQWNLHPNKDLEKILFEFGKRYIIEKIKDETIQNKERLDLNIFDQDKKCPYNPDKIENFNNYSETIYIPEKSLNNNINYNQLAIKITKKRDYINSIFFNKYNEKLFLLKSERDTSQLNQSSYSENEFTCRICSLSNMVTNLNGRKLKEILNSSIQENKTLDLLEEYLISLVKNSGKIIKTFRNINKIRQAFPIHGDENSGLIDAYAYFGIKYPIENYNEVWKILLKYYLTSLENILNILTQEKE